MTSWSDNTLTEANMKKKKEKKKEREKKIERKEKNVEIKRDLT